MERIAERLERQSQRIAQMQRDCETFAIAHQDQRIKLLNIVNLANQFDETEHKTIDTKLVSEMIKTALEQ